MGSALAPGLLLFSFCYAKAPGRIHVRFIPLGGFSGPISLGDAGHSPLESFLRILPLDHGPGPMTLGDSVSGMSSIDKMLQSILREVDHEHTEKDLVPMMKLHARDRFGERHPCKKDADKWCAKEEFSSLHCLGQHVEKLSGQCVKAIEKAIPFVCSMEITMFCPPAKVMETTVLQCLEAETNRHANKISEPCKDSIASTRSIVDKLKKSRPHLVDLATGEILTVFNAGKSFVSAVFSFLLYGSLAAALIVGLAFSFWREETLAAIRNTARHGGNGLAVFSRKEDKELADAKKHDFYDAALI